MLSNFVSTNDDGSSSRCITGKAATSIASTAFNYGIKERTGKFPYEHVIKREKQKIVNKVAAVEKPL